MHVLYLICYSLDVTALISYILEKNCMYQCGWFGVHVRIVSETLDGSE